MAAPNCYPGTEVLINREGIRDAGDLQQFERIVTGLRLRRGLPVVPLTVVGYRGLHRHLFQDVYDWAGEYRSVDIAKGAHMFCRAIFVSQEMDKRFSDLEREGGLRGLSKWAFAERMALHLAELNAIHPFREGNGRTMRAFLKIAGQHAGHAIQIDRIDPVAWLAASRDSFATGDTSSMRRVVASIVGVADVSRDRRRRN